MVDHIVSLVDYSGMDAEEPPGYLLPFLLAGAFRALVDRLHDELAEQGHPGLRPVHGFALQAIGDEQITTVQLAARLGVSKQAAAKTAASLLTLGYVERTRDPSDARARPLVVTDSGRDLLRRSARSFATLRSELVGQVGARDVRALEQGLATLAGWGGGETTALPGWVS